MGWSTWEQESPTAAGLTQPVELSCWMEKWTKYHMQGWIYFIYILQVALSDPFLHPDRGDQDWSPSHAAASARGAAAEPTPTSMDCYKVKKKSSGFRFPLLSSFQSGYFIS